ncbi:BspA family leucine-rich repeat surface protein [Flavobacterium sp. WLB]|nr:hypothetical protein APR43_18075 [Flavobacterium sp. NLM]PUU71680.1 BspA family leucine-rich repeat surface protein [Flavobacterium sp. WLB]
MGSLLQNTIFGRTKNSFISTWRTSNTSTGSSTSNQIRLPLLAVGSYNFTIDWGDGTSNNITVWNQAQTTHTYTAAGDYVIKITGVCKGWQFNNTGDRLKILSVSNWGKFNPGDVVAHFYGCANLTLDSVKDVLDLTGVKTFVNSFRGCSSISSIARVNEWNTSAVTTMASCFNSSSFNSDISNWDVSKVTDFSAMFMSSAFNQPLNTWNTISATSFANMFQNQFNQNIGNWNVSNCSNFSQMFNFNSAFNNGGSPDINNWNLKTTGTVLLSGTFTAATSFNQPIGNWNTAAVSSTNDLFSNATTFNQPIGNWNMSNNTNMSNMFIAASSFNQNIGSWNVSKVVNFSSMFGGATSFNNGGSPNINNWILNSTSNIVMNSMFSNAKNFNQPIGNWNTVQVTRTDAMFSGASLFDQNLSNWNMSNNANLSSMFQNATSFNNGGSPEINNWTLKTTGTLAINSMFSTALVFNQPIGSWNISVVSNLSAMFNGAVMFNKDLSNWDTTNITSMQNAFFGATAFNQNIGSWNISNVTNFVGFMTGKTSTNFSATNLDAIYNGWSSRPVKPSISITFGTAKHTAAASASKAILTGTPNNWTITDGGI